MCPWPRIQAALIDKNTLTVTYRSERGDPRGPHKKGETWTGRGDCIDCRRCVTACPMGIDIRNGPQLECIQCALCIDACDAVMKKVGRPSGLIAYDTDENVLLRWMKRPAARFNPFRPRTLLYAAVFIVTAGLMTVGLASRSTIEVSALKDRALPYIQLSNGDIRNTYTLKVVNKQRVARSLRVRMTGLDENRLEIIGEGASAGEITLHVQPDGVERFRLLVTAPAASAENGRRPVRIVLEDDQGHASASTLFSGPER
jgi:cytochrome c oxidase accessory protein FixG